jgi:hypothetical protein
VSLLPDFRSIQHRFLPTADSRSRQPYSTFCGTRQTRDQPALSRLNARSVGPRKGEMRKLSRSMMRKCAISLGSRSNVQPTHCRSGGTPRSTRSGTRRMRESWPTALGRRACHVGASISRTPVHFKCVVTSYLL